MAKIKNISIEVYKRNILIFIGNHSAFKYYICEYLKDNDEYNGAYRQFAGVVENSDGNTQASYWYDKNSGESIIEIPKFPTSPEEVAYCVHECLHATFHILDYANVQYEKNGSNESFTYLLELIVSRLLDKSDYKQL